MTLRDAIREMVRWCQIHRSYLTEGWRLRETFRHDIQLVATQLRHEEQRTDSVREQQAAYVVYECILEQPQEWRTATRSVWATL